MEVMDRAEYFEHNIISNHVLNDQIFRYLSKKELLKCSLISTKWVSPCRKYLQSHHECLLRMNGNDLGTTSELLDDSNNEIFYNGIYWDFSERPQDVQNLTTTVLGVLDRILKRLPTLKFVTMNMGYSVPRISTSEVLPQTNCPMELLEIEKLRIIGSILPQTWNAIFGQGVFRNLKIIHSRFSSFLCDLQYGHVLQRFPALQEWPHSVMHCDLGYFVEANKLTAVNHSPEIYGPIAPDVVQSIEAGNVTLRRLTTTFAADAENVDIFRRITTNSTTSLQEVKVTYRFFKMLIVTTEIPPLINVKKLLVEFDREDPRFEDVEAEMLADSNTRQKFPNANILRCYYYYEV